MKKTIRIVDKSESGYDFDHWLSLSPGERLSQYGELLKNRMFDEITDEHRKAVRTQYKVVEREKD